MSPHTPHKLHPLNPEGALLALGWTGGELS